MYLLLTKHQLHYSSKQKINKNINNLKMSRKPKKPKKQFKHEFKKQLRLAIAAAIGFTIAFAWRNVIFDFIYNIIRQLNEETTILQSQLTTAMIITIIGVILIIIFSKLLKDKK